MRMCALNFGQLREGVDKKKELWHLSFVIKADNWASTQTHFLKSVTSWHIQNLSLQLSVSIPALPPAQASTLDMLSSYMDRRIVRHKWQ